jgi:hypothetical protein
MTALILLVGLLQTPAASKEIFPTVGKPAPRLELRDTNDTPLDWKPLASRRTAVFFFCGCQACHDVAREWTRRQQEGHKTVSAIEPLPAVVVFAGNADELRQFQAQTGLRGDSLRFAPDPDMKAAQRYDAVPCPRAFVWDNAGILRWISPQNQGETPALKPHIMVQSVLTAALPLKKMSPAIRRKKAKS